MSTEQLDGLSPSKRADARKNIAAILDAATACLARDPDISINEIAKAAGVGRVTLYGHFESRSTLVSLVVERALQRTEETVSSLDLTGDPRAALSRMIEASWGLTHEYGALIVAAEQALPAAQVHEAHQRLFDRWKRLLRRGRRDGVLRADQPLDWQVSLIQSLIHGASAAVHRGELKATTAASLIDRTVQAALTPPGAAVPRN